MYLGKKNLNKNRLKYRNALEQILSEIETNEKRLTESINYHTQISATIVTMVRILRHCISLSIK